MKTHSSRGEFSRLASFPFTSMFQNGPRRPGSAPENLFKPGKDSPPPRTNRAPLPAAGRSEDFPMRRERRQIQRPIHSGVVRSFRVPIVPLAKITPASRPSRNHKIRPPPVDDVNNLKASWQLPALLRFDGYSDRRNALFTSPEYALRGRFESSSSSMAL